MTKQLVLFGAIVSGFHVTAFSNENNCGTRFVDQERPSGILRQSVAFDRRLLQTPNRYNTGRPVSSGEFPDLAVTSSDLPDVSGYERLDSDDLYLSPLTTEEAMEQDLQRRRRERLEGGSTLEIESDARDSEITIEDAIDQQIEFLEESLQSP